MKKVYTLILSMIFIAIGNLQSQSFEVPKNYEFKEAADYEKDIIDAANWLISTPFNEQVEKRKKVSAFVVKWVNGSPTVRVEINTTIIEFEQKNQGMLVLYMACCAKFVLENDYSKDMREKHKEALRNMMKVYKKGLGIKKDKNMDKLIKYVNKGKMDEWLEKYLKVS